MRRSHAYEGVTVRLRADAPRIPSLSISSKIWSISLFSALIFRSLRTTCRSSIRSICPSLFCAEPREARTTHKRRVEREGHQQMAPLGELLKGS